MKTMKILLPAILLMIFSAAAAAEDCAYSIRVTDPADTGFAEPAAARIISILELNGCTAVAPGEKEEITVEAVINNLYSKKRLNPTGLFLAGGLSSARKLSVVVAMSLSAKKGEEKIFDELLTHRNSTHEYFSGLRKAGAVKKRTVEDAADELAIALLSSIKGPDAEIARAPRGNGDLLNEDSDLWPILGSGLTSIAVHETGHFVNATLTGHRAEFRGNDSRTFNAGPEMVAGFSLLFGLHLNEDQLLPLLPDVIYDFHPVQTQRGLAFQDDDGNFLSHGRRDHALIAYSGILFQNTYNEYILTKHPNLIDEDNPRLKGLFFFNIFIPSFYPLWGFQDENSDMRLLRQSLEYDKWQVNSMVLVPAALDVYRYYHPEKKKLRRYARIAKIIPLIICLSQ